MSGSKFSTFSTMFYILKSSNNFCKNIFKKHDLHPDDNELTSYLNIVPFTNKTFTILLFFFLFRT